MTTLLLPLTQMLDSDTSLDISFDRDRFAPLASESTVVEIAATRIWPQRKNITIEARLAPRLRELLAIVDLELIGQDWDGYGGQPPTATAIKAALDLFGRHESVLGPPGVAPRANGGIHLEWDTPAGVEVDVEPDGSITVLVETSDDWVDYEFSGPESPELHEVLARADI
jgi:hypothetical protein